MFFTRKLFWKLFLGNVAIVAAVLAGCIWLIVSEAARFHEEDRVDHLRILASAVREAIGVRLDRQHAEELDRFAKRLGANDAEGTRYTFILADGVVLADSMSDPRVMESHADRAEVKQALARGWGHDTRMSPTLGRPMAYVAVRVGTPQAPVGVVRTAVPLRAIGEREGAIRRLIAMIGFVAFAAAAALAFVLARLWSTPIRRVTLTARSLSRGDLSARAPIIGSDELATLAVSLNQMRDRLASQLVTIDRQRRALASLLAQLHEGVIVVGPNGRITLINPAAVALLGLAADQESLVGQVAEQCIPHHELQRMLAGKAASTRSGTEPQAPSPDEVREIRLHSPSRSQPTSLLARASDIVLPSELRASEAAEGAAVPTHGRLLVLTDVTHMARMIQVKADFAANASHELRTPLSAIHAAVETLLSMDRAADANAARGFLEVIERHVRRMEAMVADLLDLSRLESSSPAQFEPEPLVVDDVLADVHARFREAIEARKLNWRTQRPPDRPRIRANAQLLRLVLDNLVDNAIKFTEPGGDVSVTVRDGKRTPENGEMIEIEVADTGCGIPEDEQGRVFERFYQVERARSGPARGTGLGLSIVRHAVTAMKGGVDLQSRPGQGTRVTFTIPQ